MMPKAPSVSFEWRVCDRDSLWLAYMYDSYKGKSSSHNTAASRAGHLHNDAVATLHI